MKILWAIIFLLLPVVAFPQGEIMLVGGGSEDDGGWSDAPYKWAVDNSSNKKVAVVSYSDEDNWIPDYFKSLGAVEATNIKIDSRELADLQSTYDELMKYDVFFFKGGDQSFYYLFFKNTKTQEAIVDKFNAGGVISGTSAGMAILSKVIFTAETASVYPDEALKNFNNADITLAGDFLPFLPGFIVDSHFTERGRIGRLLPFLAKWFVDKDELLTGIGVDDRTALCIDSNNLGVVYGTGSVSVCRAESFASVDSRPVSDSVHVSQLLYGHSINLTTLEIVNGPEDFISPKPASETGNYEVMLSGSENLGTNDDLINEFILESGSTDDHVIVVTAPGKAKAFTARLTQLDVDYNVIETASSFNGTDKWELRNAIRNSSKILFVENNDAVFFNFMDGGATGSLLKSHLRRNNIISCFIGEDSRYAGKIVVTNHLSDLYAAYYGDLVYRDGLDLLQTSVIMSNTFDATSTDYYENTTASVSYGVVKDSVKYGIYLNRGSYLKFHQTGGKNYFSATGDYPALVLVNNGTSTALASQPVNTSGDVRQYSGFNSMRYALLLNEHRISVGSTIPSADEPYTPEFPPVSTEKEFDQSSLIFFPNPSRNGIFHLSTGRPLPDNFPVTISDAVGKTVLKKNIVKSENYTLDMSSFPHGVYIILFTIGTERIATKIISQ